MSPWSNRIQPILALGALICGGCIATDARAQVASIQTANIGKVMAAPSGITTFRFAASDGSVTVTGGNGSRISTGAVRFLVNVPCTLTQCDKTNTIVTVGSIGTPTGRAGAMTNFTVTMGTATLVSGPSGANPVTFTIGAIGKNNAATFYVGADLPIYGDDSGKASGTANSSVYVTTTDSKGKNPNTSTGSATASVDHALSLTQTSSLSFGTVVRPLNPGSSCTVAMPATSGILSVSGCSAVGSASRGAFTVSGEASQTISVSVPSSVSLVNGANTLTVTASNTAQGTQILNSQGSFSFYVGGLFGLTGATPPGGYSGAYAVTVSYN